MRLNHLETRLGIDSPKAYETTAVSHKDLQRALGDYCNRLSEEMDKEKILKSGIVFVTNHTYAQRVPNFVKFLESRGKVGIGGIYSVSGHLERFGVFLHDNSNGFRLIGFLDFIANPDEIHYQGYVPGIYYDQEEIHDLGTIPGFSYVRMICSNPKNTDRKREDNWKIPFP